MSHTPEPVVTVMAPQPGPRLTRAHLGRLLAGAIIGAMLGALVAALMPLQYTATTLLQVAQASPGAPLIEPAAVVQRMSSDEFVHQALARAGLPTNTRLDPRSRLAARTLKASLARNSSLIEVRVLGYRPEDARHVLDAAVQTLQQEHEPVVMPSVRHQQDSLRGTEAALADMVQRRDRLLAKLAASAPTPDRRFPENALLAEVLRYCDAEVRRLQEQRNVLREQMDPARLFNTKSVGAIFVPEEPPTHPYALGLLFGVLGGILLAAVVMAGLDETWRQRLRAVLNEL
jgi:hypothetical protein